MTTSGRAGQQYAHTPITWAVFVGAVVMVANVDCQRRIYNSFNRHNVGFQGIEGDYCKIRIPSCCNGRQDRCSVPILGTLCYCDTFCNRTHNPDCCPDFEDVCGGAPFPRPPRPPPEELTGGADCELEGRIIANGETVSVNCNECKCNNNELHCEVDVCMVSSDVIELVNNEASNLNWKASNYSTFWAKKSREGLRMKTGTIQPDELNLKMFPIWLFYDPAKIPKNFDARTRPEWAGLVGGARDQGWCGASWAFSTVGVAEDRLAIESAGLERVTLAPQHLISCDRRGQNGCSGGHIDRAWNYLRKYGLVNEECYAYESGSTGTVDKCQIPLKSKLSELSCRSHQPRFKRKQFYKSEPAYRISSKETDIQWEILTNGPVQAFMQVHEDLFVYRSGIYAHVALRSTTPSASHSVRLVGWGEQVIKNRLVKYWIAANSWGEQWGERGFFRILRGNNECEIESFVIAVRARLLHYDDAANRIARRTRSHKAHTRRGY